ncbi:uncharacterized protein NPIL_15651 [Nephila pilipes]|uniref:Uncharacterized protein n=1 Tax=Nephila pilipes TaxID=299642 RepID=A0A8X6U844_NEPPI|nr:uncharacterized protein NPIL_15651 [Nephila pilipes]
MCKLEIIMVCIPCIIAPVLLFIWYKFIQPVVLKFWNPWAPQQTIKSSITDNNKNDEKTTTCPFAGKKEVIETSCEKELIDKKTD